jgi:hypothetical protein
MQFTLRDVFWATLVVGLTIGIVIEHNDMVALKGWKEQATWWQEAAQTLGHRLQQKGETVKLDEQNLEVKDAAGKSILSRGKGSVLRGWQTISWLTGHVELDWILAIGTPLLLLFGLLFWWAQRYRAQHPVAVPDFKPHRSYLTGCINVFGLLLFSAMAIGAYSNRQPFIGAFNVLGVALQIFCLRYFGFREITPEYIANFNATYHQPFTLQEAFRW